MANGRRRDTAREAHWRRVVRGQQHSGLSIRQFCREQQVRESAFYHWRSELRRRAAEILSGVALAKPEGRRRQPCPSTAAFVPVHVTRDAGPAAPGRIEIVLSGGRRIRVMAPVDRAALADVLAVLATASLERREARPC